MEEIYLAGGCLWGVQEFFRHIPGVIDTEAGRANGTSQSLEGLYDGYAECVRVRFDPAQVSVSQLIGHLFEIIDPYSLNCQGPDVGPKYRTGIYSRDPAHLRTAQACLASRPDFDRIVVEVAPLTHYLRSDDAHQDRLTRLPEETCHLPRALLHKYKRADGDAPA